MTAKYTWMIIMAWAAYVLMMVGCVPPAMFSSADDTARVGIRTLKQAEFGVGRTDLLGRYLTDKNGASVYVFHKDRRNFSDCSGSCAVAWPPVLTEGKPIAGPGVDSEMLGSVERVDRTVQATYNGWPLYYYNGDVKPGDRNGHGVLDFDARWYLISPEGEVLSR